MRILPGAVAVGALALFSVPVAATELAFLAVDPSASAMQLAPPVLSPLEHAIKDRLEHFQTSPDPIEDAVLAEMRAYYAARGYKPVWLVERQATPQMTALRRRMDVADVHGLNPASYATPKFARLYLPEPQLLAEADVEFSRAVALFVTHFSSGHIVPTQISRLITLKPARPHVSDILARLPYTSNTGLELARYEPPHPQYLALKAKLAELRASTRETEQPFVPAGRLLRPGMEDERVPLLRARLALTPVLIDANVYDPALTEAVKAFQSANELKPDGVVGPRTVSALNGISREEQASAVIANMERWRWMPRDMGAFHIMVNVPEFMVRVVENGSVVHETRVIVGKPSNPTPTFSNVMDHLVVNPFWNVPTSIISKEMLPEIRQDPYGYFARHGYQVLARSGGRYRVVNPWNIDWWSVNPRALQIRQVPGDFNALGRIKFMFPNQHSVYLHDTPTKRLFERDSRAFSHGCVRVDNPLAFADSFLVVAAPEWNSKRLQRLYGGPERRVNLDNPIPVHLTYFTMTVDSEGGLHPFQDIYGYDRKMTEALGS